MKRDFNKIVIVTSEFPPDPGGIGNHAYNLAKHFQQHQFEVTVISDQRSVDTFKENVFDNKQPFHVQRVKLRRVRFFMYLHRLILVLKAIANNHIVLASGKFSLWTVGLATYIYDKKFISIIHGSEVNLTNTILKKVTNFSLKRFHKVIAVSNFTKNLVAHLNLPNIKVISNGFEIKKIKEVAFEFQKKGNLNLITIGNVSQRKGQLNVINALPSILKKYPDTQYHMIGIPSLQNELTKAAKKLQVENHITFYGKLSDGKMYSLLKNSDVFLMLSENTSSGDVEGFGIALLEANYFGIPTIGSKNCGIEDAIDDNASGVLVNPKNHQEIVEAITKITTNTSYYEEHSKLWAAKFSWDLIIQEYIKYIQD